MAIDDAEVYALTAKGDRELKAAGTALSVEELQIIVLCDGFSCVEDVARRAVGVSRETLDTLLHKLVVDKLLAPTSGDDGMASGYSTIAVPLGFFSGISSDASAEADGGAEILKRKGFYVRIARQAAERERKAGWQPTLLVIDDDPDLQKLIRQYFQMEGFQLRAALKRDDIVLALRKPPTPDLILLDVNLPDINGFDVLARMRQHPVLKDVPIVMLTAESSRAAVLKGLRGGADGYVTKPFEADVLVTAVKTVLGLSAPASNNSGARGDKPRGAPPAS